VTGEIAESARTAHAAMLAGTGGEGVLAFEGLGGGADLVAPSKVASGLPHHAFATLLVSVLHLDGSLAIMASPPTLVLK
jgi:hypothetical protein